MRTLRNLIGSPIGFFAFEALLGLSALLRGNSKEIRLVRDLKSDGTVLVESAF